MKDYSHSSGLSMLTVITCCGDGSRILSLARKYGIKGGTMLLGKGTSTGSLLKFLELCDSRKEITLMVCNSRTASNVIEQLDREVKFNKRGHGIAFIIPLDKVFGVSSFQEEAADDKEGANMYKAIFTIVERGQAEAVMDAANSAGARGGTIINARGSGIHETSKLFAMEIEPEKEIVLIIASASLAESITGAIREQLHVDDPGKGIIFTTDVTRAFGLN
jgi:nitrogen regulatory protein PII